MSIASVEPCIRRRDVVAAEITKIMSHPAAVLAALLTLAANTLLAAIAASEVVRFGAGDDTAPLSAFAAVMFAPVYAFLVLPVYAAGSEYHGGQFRMSLTATPDRRVLATAKCLAMLAVVVPVAIVVVLPARLILGISDGLSFADITIDLGRWVAAYIFMSVIAFGIAGILRNTIAPLTIFVMVGIFAGAGFIQWPEGIRFLPDQASMSLLGTPAFEATKLSPGVAALALAVWATISTTAYVVTLIRRDT